MTLYFPGVSADEFDFQADWLVKKIAADTMKILFEGQGKNAGLELVLDFKSNSEKFETFSVGELVQLPAETFTEIKTESYQPIYENF